MDATQLTPGKPALYLRTISYLKPEQVFHRVRYALHSRLPALSRLTAGRLDHGSCEWQPLKPTVAFAAYPWFKPQDIEKGRFVFLNEVSEAEGSVDWRAPGKNRLWRYNLHYFQYLLGTPPLEPDVALGLMEDWIARNPPGAPDAWDPFPISLRVVNWLKYLSLCPSSAGTVEGVMDSACAQVRRLERSLEWHLLGNHLFKNAKALVFAGLCFRGREAARWLRKGLNLLCRELAEQILPDGGHFERSPMYHSMLLEDCLDLLNLCQGQDDLPQGGLSNRLQDKVTIVSRRHSADNRNPENCLDTGFRRYDETGLDTYLCCALLSSRLQQVISSMMSFLQGMTHPDGEIALFNDAAFGIELPPALLADYCHRVSKGIDATSSTQRHEVSARAGSLMLWGPGAERHWSFPDTGYFVMAPRNGDRLIIDCGAVGPDYQPGHAHCDTLSFELSLKGRRVIVDSGCCRYEDGPVRQYQRGNAGHNTITVDGINQSEVWEAHRCARRAKPLYAGLEERTDGTLVFEGAHDGYRRLAGSPIHHRRVIWGGDGLSIEDRVAGTGVHTIEARLHIHPELRVEWDGGVAVVLAGDEVVARIARAGHGDIELTTGWYASEFGKNEVCAVLRVFQRESLPHVGGWIIADCHHD